MVFQSMIVAAPHRAGRFLALTELSPLYIDPFPFSLLLSVFVPFVCAPYQRIFIVHT